MMETVFAGCFAVLMTAAFLVLIRMIKGPHAVDRVLSLDLLSVLAASLFAISAGWVGESVFLDATLATGMVAFFSTLLLARYVENRGRA
ncbi:MAG TPA: monovalent cation/H+ antiporter complex subunit F [Pseudobdellovibrionaceae bacterium]|nr:monovalent cation/H+ antiporter complex subunit F [Pseudobdellovibrionaceae bacterium]